MKKFIITSTDFDHYQTIFEVKQNTLHLVRYDFEEDLFHDEFATTSFKFALPTEIVQKILFHLILTCIKSANFEKALSLISISPYQIKHFYRFFFGAPETLHVATLNLRISEMFKLADEIVHGIVQFPNEEHDHYFALEIMYKKHFQPYYQYQPWNFNGSISLFQIPRPGIINLEDFKAFVTGPNLTDVVWMTGYTRNGIVATTFFRQPVITLVFTDRKGNVIPELHTIKNSTTFKGFADILRLAFGPTSGIFFAVKGEYILDDNLVVEL